MKVLYAASEVAPFSKTGGLADVAGALPAALARAGAQVTVVTPLHRGITREDLEPLPQEVRLKFPFGEERAVLWEKRLAGGHRVVFLDHRGFFDRPFLYNQGSVDYPDNARRFGFFSVAVLCVAQVLGVDPQVVHLNDWQTGLAGFALRSGFEGSPLSRARVVFTIHNLAYQGVFPKSAMGELGIPWDVFRPSGLEFYDQLSFLKAGIHWADAVTTVSPTYAKEICTPEGGWGLDGLLREKGSALKGILNGVDYAAWDPGADPALPEPFTAQRPQGKRVCKQALLARLGLPASAIDRPLFATVGRLAEQKGVDLLLAALPRVLPQPMSMVVLGSGDAGYEHGLRQLAAAHPGQVAVTFRFDEGLSHLMEAGADFFVMPSRFEPCGLNQMYSLRYGTIPLVRSTGGLEDTVVDLALPQGTGIKFQALTVEALVGAFERARALYADPEALAAVQRRGMEARFSWEASAHAYLALYRSLVPPGKAK